MLNRKMKPIAAAVGAAFAASLAPSAAADAANLEAAADPFETRALDGVLFATKHKEGGCGEDKPAEGDDKAEGECGEGKCGEEGEGHEEGEGDADADSEEAESGDAEEES